MGLLLFLLGPPTNQSRQLAAHKAAHLLFLVRQLVPRYDQIGNLARRVCGKPDAEKAGEACTTEIKATVTGTVSEKDGKKWITPTKIEKQ